MFLEADCFKSTVLSKHLRIKADRNVHVHKLIVDSHSE